MLSAITQPSPPSSGIILISVPVSKENENVSATTYVHVMSCIPRRYLHYGMSDHSARCFKQSPSEERYWFARRHRVMKSAEPLITSIFILSIVSPSYDIDDNDLIEFLCPLIMGHLCSCAILLLRRFSIPELIILYGIMMKSSHQITMTNIVIKQASEECCYDSAC